MSERETLALVRRLLAEGLEQKAGSSTYIRDLAILIGDLRATMRAAVAVIDQAGADQ